MEITTAQWVEFMNAAFDRPAGNFIPHASMPDVWGATSVAPTNTGGHRWTVSPSNSLRAVGGIDWRTAAIYCNWLCNGKATNREAFLTGAYDVSTFGYQPGDSIFTDQAARTPGAAYFIPTWDEWLKAVHYDPNKANADGTTGGWWTRPNGTDTPLIYAPPPSFGGNGTGQANSVFSLPNFAEFLIPLGSYPQTTTPWGLLDAAGMTTEWTESIATATTGDRYRILDGSGAGQPDGRPLDLIPHRSSEYPNLTFADYGLRIGMAVPNPSGLFVIGIGLITHGKRRR